MKKIFGGKGKSNVKKKKHEEGGSGADVHRSEKKERRKTGGDLSGVKNVWGNLLKRYSVGNCVCRFGEFGKEKRKMRAKMTGSKQKLCKI